MMYAAVGMGAGIAGGLVLTQLMRSMLYGIPPSDPATFVIASVSLFIAVVVAAYLPARRAAGIDPAGALRNE
jgi:ABC-type antimicrobial peptide transport system permease subunit